jgi:DNA anti-recombination protein RmuC
VSKTILAAAFACLLAAPALAGMTTDAQPSQRDRFLTTQELLSRLRSRVRCSHQVAQKTEMKQDDAQARRDEIRTKFDELYREHERFSLSLDEAQTALVQTRLNRIVKIRRHVLHRLNQLDDYVAVKAPDSHRIAERTREIADQLREWQKHYRKVKGHLAI